MRTEDNIVLTLKIKNPHELIIYLKKRSVMNNKTNTLKRSIRNKILSCIDNLRQSNPELEKIVIDIIKNEGIIKQDDQMEMISKTSQ